MDVATLITSSFSGTTTNAFDRLMAGSRRLSELEQLNHRPQLPATKRSSSPGFTQKDALKNHVIENRDFKDKHQADKDCVLTLIDVLEY